MEIQYYGANCVKITTKKTDVMTDVKSNITTLGANYKKAHIILATQPDFVPDDSPADSFVISSPGEYEFADLSIKGLAARSSMDLDEKNSATIYRLNSSDIKLLILGHVSNPLSEEQLESIGVVDILVVPIGGNGYTLDAVQAAAMVRSVEPKLVIPVHHKEDGLKYEVPQAELELFVKELGATLAEATAKLKIKALPEQLTIQPLTRST